MAIISSLVVSSTKPSTTLDQSLSIIETTQFNYSINNSPNGLIGDCLGTETMQLPGIRKCINRLIINFQCNHPDHWSDLAYCMSLPIEKLYQHKRPEYNYGL